MNKTRSLAFVTLLASVCTASLIAQTSPAASPATTPAVPQAKAASTGGRSPHETVSAVIGDRRTGNRVTITYGRPYTIKPGTTVVRKIWGGQVPWDKADRLGADEATLLMTQKPLVIGETTIPAGAYTLYIIPSENGTSKLAVSTNIGKWGVPVDETKDLARFDLKKESLEKSVDQLTIAIANEPAGSDTGVIKISWENTQFSLPFAVKK
jgi:hypothetical protein